MRFLAFALAGLNLLIGANAALNVSGIRDSSKYAPATTAIAAIVFVGLGGYGVYAAHVLGATRQAVWLGIAPWAVVLVGMFLTLVLSNPR